MAIAGAWGAGARRGERARPQGRRAKHSPEPFCHPTPYSRTTMTHESTMRSPLGGAAPTAAQDSEESLNPFGVYPDLKPASWLGRGGRVVSLGVADGHGPVERSGGRKAHAGVMHMTAGDGPCLRNHARLGWPPTSQRRQFPWWTCSSDRTTVLVTGSMEGGPPPPLC